MAKQFRTAAAFKASLEAHLRRRSEDLGVPFSTLQLRFVFERLLARLFRDESPPWLLKGGFAMDLRFRPRARTTKDIDLSVTLVADEAGPVSAAMRERLQAAVDVELGDHLTFRVGRPGRSSRTPRRVVADIRAKRSSSVRPMPGFTSTSGSGTPWSAPRSD